LPYVNFCFSVDGTERVFEYLRYPGKWSTLVDNIKWVQDQGYLASVSYTISNLNVLYHEQTINWFDQNKLPYLENPVYTPSYFSPRALTFDIKQKILQQVKHTTVVKLLSSHSENDEQLYQDFLKEIARQDRLKNIQIADYLPEFLALAQ
jgi:sulfatase maturation enzyme AslB (radical SAM superfamily)